jgi:hypothetical protein
VSLESVRTDHECTGYVRDQLLIEFEGHEEKLTEYGFDVVIGVAKSPQRRNGNGTR